MIRKRTRQPETIEAEPDEEQAAEPMTAPTDLAAAAEYDRLMAADLRERASLSRAGAEARETAVRQEAARSVADAVAARSETDRQAAATDRQAAALEQRGQHLAHAADLETRAEDAERQTDALADERDRLTAEMADLDGKLARLSADKDQLATELTAARESGDLDAITAVRNRIASCEDLAATVTSLRATALARAEAIGDGDDPGGELADATATASARRAELRRVLNTAFPDRREAVADRLMNDLQGALKGNLERIAEEGKPQQPKRVFGHVHL
jgi:hypothetical protein